MRQSLLFALLAVVWGGSINTPGSSGYKSVAYFVDWPLYDNFTPQMLPSANLTHILYAFADIDPSGEVILAHPWEDTDMHYPSDPSSETGNNLYGNLKQLYLLKRQNEKLKVLLSIGGWNYSSHFGLPASTDTGRSKFASSVVSLVGDLGLDGVDIDWEYPINASQASDFVLLLKAVREALDSYASLPEIYGGPPNKPYHFLLSVAGPGPFGYQQLQLPDMDQLVDSWNLMAYDYAGNWSDVTADLANVKASLDRPETTPFDTEAVVNHYISQNINAAKITLGIPLYGRAFNNTSGLGEPFNGTDIYYFNNLPLSGSAISYDNTTISSYSYDTTRRQLVSYDILDVIMDKARWIKETQLGGAMYWQSKWDVLGSESAIQNIAAVLGGEDGLGLDSTANLLNYPNSTYDNLRSGMPEFSTSSTAVSIASASATETTFIPSIEVSSSSPPESTATCVAATCHNYEARRCAGGMACSCALDASNQAVCILHRLCDGAVVCSTNTDCTNANEVCIIDNCCDDQGRCVLLTNGCTDSPLCKRYDAGWLANGIGLLGTSAMLHC